MKQQESTTKLAEPGINQVDPSRNPTELTNNPA